MYTFHTVILLVNTFDRPRKHTMLSWQYINIGKASQCFVRGYCLIARKYVLQLQIIFVIYGTRTWTLLSLFSRIAGQTTILSMVCCHFIHNFESFGWRKDGRFKQEAGRGGRRTDWKGVILLLRSDGRAVYRGGISRLLDLIDFTPFGPYGSDLWSDLVAGDLISEMGL